MNADFKSISSEAPVDPFYSESNIRHLEKIALDIALGQAHFAEHKLWETEK